MIQLIVRCMTLKQYNYTQLSKIFCITLRSLQIYSEIMIIISKNKDCDQ